MKKVLILLLIIILGKTICFSQNILGTINQDSIVSITSTELKYANIIFTEHQSLSKENMLLQQQLTNFTKLIEVLSEVDSTRILQLKELNNLNKAQFEQINFLENEVKKKNKVIKCWQIGGIAVSVSLVLFLVLK